MNLKHLTTILLASLTSIAGFGWGQKGHDTVTCIAENNLTEYTKSAIDSLLDGKSIIYYANWLDNASHTPAYAYSKTWHYKNIDADQTFRSAPLLKEGDVVRAIYMQVDSLNNPSTSFEGKQLALKILVHLVGDLHQPMHLGHASDLGGNRWYVKFFGNKTNLHSAWDSRILENGHKWSYTEWSAQIDRGNKELTEEILTNSNPENWANQTYEICKQIYAKTPVNTDIRFDYVAEWTPVIEKQLLSGGIRLADLLNSIFDPNYKGAWTPIPR